MLRKLTFKGVEFEVSPCGETIIFEGRLLPQTEVDPNKNGKVFKLVSADGKPFYVHHLVASAYVKNPNPEKYKMVLHKDCNTSSNHYLNLEYGDYVMNMENRAKMGLNGRSISPINEENAVKIAARLDAGEFANVICKEFDVSEMSIRRIRRRYCKTKTVSKRYPLEVKQTVLKLVAKHGTSAAAKLAGVKY